MTERSQARPRGALLLYRLVAMIADLADLGRLDAARVVALIAPLRRLVATATFLVFRCNLRGRRGWFVGGEEYAGGKEKEER